jgi:RND family efflux transporter MFP subunit
MQPEISAAASVESLSDSRISAELNATIKTIPVRVGDIVAPGDILVQLDCSDYELRADELTARLEAGTARAGFARQQLQRARKLESSRTMSQEVLDQREAELVSLAAEAAAQQALLNQINHERGKCTLRAPFKAVVLERLAHTGEYAMPATPLVRILAIEQLEVSAAVISGDAAGLENAATILFRYDGHDYPVRLRTLTPVIDPQTRTRQARLLFSGASALPGAAGRLIWYQPPALPADLLVRRQGQLGVLLAQQGRARFHPLPDAREGRPATIDLPAATLIITAGRFAVNEGDRLNISGAAQTAPAPPQPEHKPAGAPQPESAPAADPAAESAPVMGDIGA